MTLDSGVITGFFEGSEEGLTIYGTSITNPVGIGVDIEAGSIFARNFYTGDMRDVLAYDRVLTDQEILDLHNNPPTPLP